MKKIAIAAALSAALGLHLINLSGKKHLAQPSGSGDNRWQAARRLGISGQSGRSGTIEHFAGLWQLLSGFRQWRRQQSLSLWLSESADLADFRRLGHSGSCRGCQSHKRTRVDLLLHLQSGRAGSAPGQRLWNYGVGTSGCRSSNREK